MKNHNMIIDVEENPTRIRDWFLFSIQHILAMLVACITVPLLTGLPVGATLVAAGVGTLIYVFVTKKKSPVFLSSSFAYLAPMFAALSLGVGYDVFGKQVTTNNFWAVILGMAMVGVVYVVIALIIKKTGTSWLNKLLPPVVIGPIIMVIGLSLAGSAVSNVMGGTSAIAAIGKDDPIAWQYTAVSIFVGLFACFLTAIAAHFGKKTVSLIPFVIGMGGAYLLSLALTGLSYINGLEFLRVIDFGVFDKDWGSIESWINCDWMFTRAINQTAEFNWGTVGSVALLFVPVSLVTICEHIGDHKNLGNILDRDLLDGEPGLTRTLIGDGLATAVSGGLCGAANTTYGENVAVIGVSRIASINVIILASFMAIFFGLFAPITTVLETVPKCITGGVSLILYGFIASSGVKMLLKEKVDFNVTKNIIVASVILVTGIGGLLFVFGGNNGGYTIQITSTAVAMLLGIILNLVLKDQKHNNVVDTTMEDIDE